ncbi:MAG: shikimate kinase [Candidatus Margulisbacteria bacterium]|jgi:shikimate kinase|nr:shikimate kinase [Candidatus Margulisiibacteriota bacterium]
MNIVLIGFMGSGKTSTGRLLAKQLGYRFIDTDNLIEQQNGMTVANIFARKGEEFFRQQETALLKQLNGADNSVIATGGGIVLTGENRLLLRELGEVVYLQTAAAEIIKRLDGDTTRPLLSAADKYEEITRMLEIRQPLYQAAANCITGTFTGHPEKSAERILQLLKIGVK